MGGPERYRFRDDVLRSAASRTRRRLLVSMIAAAAAVVGLWAAALRPQGAGPRTLGFALVLLGALAFVSLRRRLSRLHARWTSFELTLDAEAIGREVVGFPSVRIARAEVAAIGERAAGIVVSDRAGRALLVPRELEGYERVREALAAWGPPRTDAS
ncbi:MAG TPA: hypothetical protein VF912_08320 [Anaeromyxobacter sp.]